MGTPAPQPDRRAPRADPRSSSRAEETADALRALIIDGSLVPGAGLREAELAERLGVSRNTLRESFRLLSKERLVEQVPNRGASVAFPSITSILDVYRVRRLIETQAVEQAFPRHHAVARMREAVKAGRAAREAGDWQGVGTANIAFHSAVVELTDSPRLMRFTEQLSAELRLAFGLVDDPEYLHAPFLDRNAEIVQLVEDGETRAAAALLDDYLQRAERLLLTAYERLEGRP